MINSYLSAKLCENNIIKVMVFSDLEKGEKDPIVLDTNGETSEKLTIIRETHLSGICVYECAPKEKIVLGNTYNILIRDLGVTPLNVNDVTSFKNFDEEYFYNEDDLGANYSKEKTTFKLWAPLSSGVILLIKKTKEEHFVSYVMKRAEKGVYSYTLEEDCDGYLYRYKITNSGLTFITTDPYGKSSDANGRSSAVINLDRITKMFKDEHKLTKISYLDSIIYELHIRDFTIDQNTNIVNKGKYLGLVEENRTTKGNNPAGLDYLKFLGITHVQLLPVLDYQTVNELKPDETYNWGYDPQQYFTLEGSYSTDPNNPYSRVFEFKEMVTKLHQNDIRVNLDVVFNHVYDNLTGMFEKIVPNYYFKKHHNGRLSNDSSCGNDLDTTRPMVRKMIIDCLKFYLNTYKVDGFRFDLMGLIDLETMKQVDKELRKINPDIMLYGEGWDMSSTLSSENKSIPANAAKIKNIAFFNDSFRDIVKGHFGSNSGGYLCGDIDSLEAFKFVFRGSIINYCYDKKYDNLSQCLNYVECHDNQTLFDELSLRIADSSNVLRCICLINFFVLMSYGISFFHAGQEIGLTKFNQGNTYNLGDKFNKFDYQILDKNFSLANYLSSIIKFKKEYMQNLVLSEEYLDKNIYFTNLENGGLIIRFFNFANKFKDVIMVINPTDEAINVDLGDDYEVLISHVGYCKDLSLVVRDLPLNQYEVNMLVRK